MTSLVQSVSVTGLAGATSATATISATTVGNSLVVASSIGQSGSSAAPTWSNGGTALTWTNRNDTNIGGGWAQIADSLNAATTTSSVTLTGGGGGSGFLHGGFTVCEVSGSGTAALDATANGNTSSFVTTVTATAANEVGTTDFVIATVSTGDNSASGGMSTPATGNSITYTSLYVEQDGNTKSIGEQSYRIESSAVTSPAATWSWTNTAQASAAIATYKFSGGGGSAITYPELERGHRGTSRGVSMGVA